VTDRVIDASALVLALGGKTGEAAALRNRLPGRVATRRTSSMPKWAACCVGTSRPGV
jgi:hypothetical protein